MRPAYVRGVGLWSPGHADADSWCRGEPDESVREPGAALLAGPGRRRATPLTRLAAEAFQQAVEAAGCDPAAVASVWVTAHGENENAAAMLDMMGRGSGKLSPTRFHNSVYNTASGYVSIATGNRGPATTLTGGPEIVGGALLEALCQLEAGASEVALVYADEPLRPPFAAADVQAPLAVAFCLSGRPTGARVQLSDPRREEVAAAKRRERFGPLYVSATLPLLEAVVAGRPGTIPLELEGGGSTRIWCVDLELL